MEEILILNKTNNKKTFKVNPEKPYFKINKLSIPSIPKNSTNIISLAPKFIIRTKVTDINGTQNSNIINGIISFITAQHREAVFDINQVLVFDSLSDTIEIEFENNDEKDDDILIHYTRFNQIVDLKNPFIEFNTHITQPDNVKILFSGPFGQGKTTFLNHFFENNETTYEVFTLYPVNYAVSHNEDIFKYIKAEILFQLMEKDVEFDKLEFNYSEATFSYFSQNIDKIISPLLSLLPKVGETAAKVFDKIFELSKAIKNHKSELDINDEKDALKYIKELYEKEGSIFEDNFYTQLIRQLLQQHKEKYKKENVLIIDDIDRMDPDHIFRIFNVFSANFDSSEYRIGLSNKFGFDKIILVCDYTSIKKLFSHKYGNSISFEGYLSKYYSKKPYEYDNNKAIEVITTQLTNHNNTPINCVIANILKLIINDLVHSNEIVLRDLLKLLKNNFYSTIDAQSKIFSETHKKHNHHLLYFNIIAFLEHVFDKETVLEKIKRSRNKAPTRNRVNYKYYTEIGLIALVSDQIISETDSVVFKGETFIFKTNQTSDRPLNYDYYEAIEVKTQHGQTYKFGMKDFYDMLILNTEKYIEG